MDVSQLIACGLRPTQAASFAPVLGGVFERFHIESPPQRAAFLAHTMHETRGYTKLEEDLYYLRPEAIAAAFKRLRHLPPDELVALCRNPQALANAAYADHTGNRGVASGDGWNSRGSGLMHLTGLDNFRAAAQATGHDYVAHPEWVRNHLEDAALSAGWFWDHKGCNALIDANNFAATTRRINGGDNGAAKRFALYQTCLAVLV